ncbi:MAG: hypothetical protein Q9227_008058 [Pyrenula ochraceoflavens]
MSSPEKPAKTSTPRKPKATDANPDKTKDPAWIILSVLAHANEISGINTSAVAQHFGIAHSKNALRQFKTIVERYGFTYESGKIRFANESGKEVNANGASTSTTEGQNGNAETSTTTATPTKEKKKPTPRSKKVKKEAGANEDEATGDADDGDGSPTKKRKVATKPKVKENDEEKENSE